MKAVVIGTGRIGCGLIGQLLRSSGYDVAFVARNLQTLKCLNDARRYRVRLVIGTESKEIIVDGIRAVSAADVSCVAEEIAEADLIATAVGPTNLPGIAPLIAAGLRLRSAPLNIIAFENLHNAGPYLRTLVANHLPPDFPMGQYGFSGAVVMRVVSRREIDLSKNEPLIFVGDPPTTFVVEGNLLRHPLPAVEGMVLTDNYTAWVQRKLFIFNAAHAICAYLGYLKGYHYIHAAIRDKEIRAAVFGAMVEAQRGIEASYGSKLAGDKTDLRQILIRFENAALNDSVIRVGREPRRKLGVEDRLVGAARLAEKAGVCPEKLALGVAAALQFCDPADPMSVEFQSEIDQFGLDFVLGQTSGIDCRSSLGRLIINASNQLENSWQQDNLLLSLNQMLWAWYRP
jgi:mannitol-1-phosphate 5-dehydrogenase